MIHNSGSVEGNVNRNQDDQDGKLYGRAKFDLPDRKRILLARIAHASRKLRQNRRTARGQPETARLMATVSGSGANFRDAL